MDKSQKKAVIEVKGLNKWYDDFHVLRDISLNIYEKEIVVICGTSGSGKSTLIRCMNQLELYQEGEIKLFDKKLANDKQTRLHIRQNVGMIFQSFNLFPHLTVLENCILGLTHLQKVPETKAIKQALDLLELVGVAHLSKHFPGQISGGQQQRVAIARTLAMKPKIVLLDEPTSAIDPEMINEVLNVMINLAKSGITMVCVTHEMNFARQVADRVIFMTEGQIVEQGTAKQVLENPQWDRTSDFLSSIL